MRLGYSQNATCWKPSWPTSQSFIRTACCAPRGPRAHSRFTHEGTPGLRTHGRSRIVHVNQHPVVSGLAIDLRLPAVRLNRRAAGTLFGTEVPIELGPCCAPVNMYGNVAH